MMYKYANGTLPNVMNDLYTPNTAIHTHFTRQHAMLHLSKGTINLYTKSFRYTSALIWNLIQTKFDVHVQVSKFKITFRKFLHNNAVELTYPK